MYWYPIIRLAGGALNACASIVRENETAQDKTIPMMTEEILQILIRLRIGIDTDPSFTYIRDYSSVYWDMNALQVLFEH